MPHQHYSGAIIATASWMMGESEIILSGPRGQLREGYHDRQGDVPDPGEAGKRGQVSGALEGGRGRFEGSKGLQVQGVDPSGGRGRDCLLYTSDAADDLLCVDLG